MVFTPFRQGIRAALQKPPVVTMASTLKDSVLHWRKKLERTEDESVILNVIHKLGKVPVTVELLQDTGIGKIIRSLAKKPGVIGHKATTVLHNWRELVSSAPKFPDTIVEVRTKSNSSKSERKDRNDSFKSHKNSSSSHERQNNKDKKSSSFSSKQHLNTNKHSSKSHTNDVLNETDGSDYASYHHGFDSTFKTSNTDESDVETTSVAKSSHSNKRKSLETSPSCTEKHVSEAKRLKTNSDFTSDSSHYKNESAKSHSSHKKKSKEKSYDSGIQNDVEAFLNSYSHNGFSKSSEKEKSSSKKPKKNKDNDKKSHSEVKKALKIKPTESFTASEARFEDVLNFSDVCIPVKKKKSSKITSTDKKEKHRERENSSKNVVEKSRPKEASVSKPPTAKLSAMPLTTRLPEQDKNSIPSLLSDSAQKSLPKINEVDILSTLPQTQPNYRPLPQRNFDCLPGKKKVLTNEDAIKFTSSRKERTSVYSGRKNLFYTEMPTLFECCTRVLIENIDAIEYLGEVPYFLLKPVLERCTPLQLYNIEDYNPYLLDDTHELWEAHCKRDFRTEKLLENETWRELYLRAFEERERKLKNITANISASMSKSGPARQVKLAYVNTVAKPPRDVARKQAKMGTALPVNQTVKAGPPAKASPRPTAPAINSAASSSKPEHSIPKSKPKIAPLMAKTLKSMKQCYRR